MRYWECKACTALTKAEISNCWNCGSERSSERRVIEDATHDATDALARKRREPRLAHVLPSILIFVIAGPLVGLFALVFGDIGKPNFFNAFLFVVIGAYAIGGPAAALAGLLYALTCIALVAASPKLNIRYLLGATVGVCVSLIAVSALMHLMLSDSASREREIAEFSPLGALAGAVCGAVSGCLFPVGRRNATPRARGDA